MQASPSAPASRAHLSRLMQIWRSAGWPCRDAIEIDLMAAGWVALADSAGHESLRLTEQGVQVLAAARQRNQRASSMHDRLGQRVARQLMQAGRIVWLELSLRAQFNGDAESSASSEMALASEAQALLEALPPADPVRKANWRMARPDVFSVRNTSVEHYLQPMVHEIKVSRADLLSDLRHAAKRESYQWLCCECHYVFPAGVADPDEIPEAFGVQILHGDIDNGRLETVRPAKHVPCKLPFPVWLELAKATPLRADPTEVMQQHLGDEMGPVVDGAAFQGPALGPGQP